jgi:hypothetical protein
VTSLSTIFFGVELHAVRAGEKVLTELGRFLRALCISIAGSEHTAGTGKEPALP